MVDGMIERLESRALCAAPAAVLPAGAVPAPAPAPAPGADVTSPTLNMVRIQGPPGEATGVVLQFSEPLDPSAAADVNHYAVRGTPRVFVTRSTRRNLTLASAVYDEATRTVTLVPEKRPFDPGRHLRGLRARAAITDTAGNPLDGDGDGTREARDDAVWAFRHVRRGRSLVYFDATRSRVRLRLSAPGRMRLMQRLEGTEVVAQETDDGLWAAGFKTNHWGEGMFLWIEAAAPGAVLTGTVTPYGHGLEDATTSLVEIFNPAGARLDLLNDQAFQVGT